MYNVYSVTGMFSEKIIIQKDGFKVYYELKEDGLFVYNNFDIKKATKLNEYFFNKEKIDILCKVFDSIDYFKEMNYKDVYLFYHISRKEMYAYIDNKRMRITSSGYVDYDSFKKEEIYKLLNKDLNNSQVMYEDLLDGQFNVYKKQMTKNVIEYLEHNDNEKLIVKMKEEYKDKFPKEEESKGFVIEGVCLNIGHEIINLMEIRNIEYSQDSLRLYYKNTSEYSFVRDINKEVAAKIKQGYMDVLNKVKQEL